MTYDILHLFKFDHLPVPLKERSKPFCDLAHQLARELPANAETSVALRKLLEAKDAAVRALVLMKATHTSTDRLCREVIVEATNFDFIYFDQEGLGWISNTFIEGWEKANNRTASV